MGTNTDLIIGEFTKRPEQLPPEKLKQAQGLAGVLTGIRKIVYFLFALITSGAAILYLKQFVPEIIGTILLVLFIIFGLFKIRDFVRGTI